MFRGKSGQLAWLGNFNTQFQGVPMVDPVEISSFNYSYNLNDYITKVDASRGSLTMEDTSQSPPFPPVLKSIISYDYDSLNQLTNSTDPLVTGDESFEYDILGNRLRSGNETVDSTFNQMNQLVRDKKFSYVYDKNGNLIEKTSLTTGAVTEYQWSYKNELLEVTKRGAALGGVEGAIESQVSYRYDAFGRRIRKNINGEITKYVYDQDNILLELDQWNNLKARYLHSGVDQIWRMERKDTPYYDESFQEQYFYFLRDRIGNITEVTNFVGDVVQRYVYDAFGKITIFDGDGNQITSSSGKYLENPFTFTGREYDAETGLYYYRARYYDPETGLFLSEDPAHFAGRDFNLYRYALNNPTTYSDPTGLLVEICQRPRDWLPPSLNFFPFTHTFLCVQGDSDRFPTCGGQSFFWES